MTQLKAFLDCRNFRRHHLAYLDDTLSGDLMTAAQRHILACDSCAAHDSMVRRSLVMARNITTIEPSSSFQQRLNDRLAECREQRRSAGRRERDDQSIIALHTDRRRPAWRSPRMMTFVVAGAVIGAFMWRESTPAEAPLMAAQPVIATQPAYPDLPYVSPAMLQAMATGNPVFPAAVIIEEAPNQFVNVNYSMSLDGR
jgi:hypothetical protein